ncbi:MAG: hypothetical protein ABA06_02225 [Parcubacteria bacterium C7867-001]|nr:MAG: hypothetical protein ABA06_02225 [Parcubacteria bacterium C7867-001]
MAHHAYFSTGDLDEGLARAREFVQYELGLPLEGNPDIFELRYGLFSVADARAVNDLARQSPVAGETKVLIVATGRLFHEAQNALLKLFEEPPEGTVLILVVPSEGIILPTLRSRILPLPTGRQAFPEGKRTKKEESEIVEAFITGTSAAREKLVAKLLDKTKSDKDTEKQAARLEALTLAEGLMRAGYRARKEGSGNDAALVAFLTDLNSFIPILHDRAAPLKPIFEHLLLVTPASLR